MNDGIYDVGRLAPILLSAILENNEPTNNNSINEVAAKNDNTDIDYNSKKQSASSNPQGLLDSIAETLTPTKLQQAIVLSEIVGKPRSKTRKRRRF